MSHDGPEEGQVSVALSRTSLVVNAPSDTPPDIYRREATAQKANVPSVIQNKAEARAAAPSLAPSLLSLLPPPQKDTHATAIGSSSDSSSSPLVPRSTVTSLSGDSLPPKESAPPAAKSSSSHKQTKTPRRSKLQKTDVRCSKNGTPSDDTGPDRKTSRPSSARTSTPTTAHAFNPSSPSQRLRSQTNPTSGNKGKLMAANASGASGDSRRGVASPRPKGRGMEVSLPMRCTDLTLALRKQEYLMSQCHHIWPLSLSEQ